MLEETTKEQEILMEGANILIISAVKHVKEHYTNFSYTSKELSDGSWEEWLRNQLEAHIYLNGGRTLSGAQKN